MLNYKEFLNENNKEVWTHEGDFNVDESMINNGKFIEGTIPTIITGSFKCTNNELTSLQGGPTEVGGDFWCNTNELATLEGSPVKVEGSFDCSNNKLINLIGGPKIVEHYYICSVNKLTSLKGCPDMLNSGIYCNINQLTSLEGGPVKVGEYYDCKNNMLTSLEYGPKNFKGILYESHNLKELKIEKKFIESGSFKQEYYTDLLNYCITNKIDLEKIESWPKGFLSDNIKSSVKSINKFNL